MLLVAFGYFRFREVRFKEVVMFVVNALLGLAGWRSFEFLLGNLQNLIIGIRICGFKVCSPKLNLKC